LLEKEHLNLVELTKYTKYCSLKPSQLLYILTLLYSNLPATSRHNSLQKITDDQLQGSYSFMFLCFYYVNLKIILKTNFVYHVSVTHFP